MKKRVSKFFFKDIMLNQLADSFLEDWNLENFMDCRTRVRILIKHHSNEIANGWCEMGWKSCIFTLADTNS